MKKYFYAGILLAVLATLSSCSRKKEIGALPDKRVQEYIFSEYLRGNTPQAFDRLMMRPVMDRGTVVYLYEKLYPECSGMIDSMDFYCDACDNGSWVDAVLISMEETRLGDEILSLLEDEANLSDPIIEENDTVEVEAVEKRLLDSYNRLKVMQYDTEYFLPVAGTDSSTIVHYSNNSALRLFYDDLYRLYKKELWRMNSVSDSKITGIEEYEYNEGSKQPAKKIIQNEKVKTVSKFNQNGLVIETEKYSAVENPEKKSEQWQYEKSPSSVTVWEYDDQNRITLELCKEKSLTKKQRFIYHNVKEGEDEIPPDYEYYENNVLKIKTEYTAKGDYTTLIVFDKSNSVKTYYKAYAKTKDVYITDGIERRVKNYE